jgi:thiopeptide-type bacteriocin biosynthesis protein
MSTEVEVAADQPERIFALRTPLLSVTKMWKATGPGDADDLSPVGDSLDAFRDSLRQEEPFRKAMALNNLRLADKMEAWLAGKPLKNEKTLPLTLYRYYARASSRPVPFGMFASCSVGTLGQGALELTIDEPDRVIVKTELDAALVLQLADRLLYGTTALDERDRLSVNGTLYGAGDEYRYLERVGNGPELRHQSTAKNSVAPIIDALRAGPLTRRELRRRLHETNSHVPEPDIALMIEAAVQAQLIRSVCEPTTIGEAPLMLPDASESVFFRRTAAAVRLLEKVHATRSLASIRHHLDWLSRHLDFLPVNSSERGRPLRTTCLRPATQMNLPAQVVEKAFTGTEILMRMLDVKEPSNLTSFRRRFVDRYGEREIRLVDALDADTGLSFGFPDQPSGLTPRAEQYLLRELCSLQQPPEVLELDATVLDREGLEPGQLRLPDAFAMSIGLSKRRSGTLEILLNGLVGPNAESTLARFTPYDPRLCAGIRAVCAAEASLRPDVTFADVLHLPGPLHQANILIRPHLRRAVIPYTISPAPTESSEMEVVYIGDLLLSCHQGVFSLRSSRSGRIILPRVSSAHNYRYSPSDVYRFLGTLQEQGVAARIGWTWGRLSSLPNTPKVVTDGIVLCPRRWRVTADEVSHFDLATVTARGTDAVRQWRSSRGIPRRVAWVSEQGRLSIDLENPLGAATLQQLSAASSAGILEEAVTADTAAVLDRAGDGYVSEAVVPLCRPSSVSPATSEGRVVLGASGPSRWAALPGSDWLYLKIFGGPVALEGFLLRRLASLLDLAISGQQIQRWFFVRYIDGEAFNLRVRINGLPEALFDFYRRDVSDLLSGLHTIDRISKVELSTYDREVARYGGDAGLDVCESIFYNDSRWVCAVLQPQSDDRGRRLVAIEGVARLLRAFRLSSDEMIGILREARAFTEDLVGIDPRSLRRTVGHLYRQQRGDVDGAYERGLNADDTLFLGLEMECQRLTELAHSHRLAVPLFQVVASLVHMHLIRVTVSPNRRVEYEAYGLLEKACRRSIEMSKRSPQ